MSCSAGAASASNHSAESRAPPAAATSPELVAFRHGVEAATKLLADDVRGVVSMIAYDGVHSSMLSIPIDKVRAARPPARPPALRPPVRPA